MSKIGKITVWNLHQEKVSADVGLNGQERFHTPFMHRVNAQLQNLKHLSIEELLQLQSEEASYWQSEHL